MTRIDDQFLFAKIIFTYCFFNVFYLRDSTF